MVRLLPIRLEISERLVRRLEKAARLAFPRETFAFLLGEDAGTNSVVTDLWFPEDEILGTTHKVLYKPVWLAEALDLAKTQDSTLIAWWHSHPYKKGQSGYSMDEYVVPSNNDLDFQSILPAMNMGITAVSEKPSGRKYVKTRFWGPIVHVETVVTHGLH